ncbi:MAG: hypothetical protein ACJA0N_000945 [Pseudohongiellaceae bacterium]|jgi:hypothetical protein
MSATPNLHIMSVITFIALLPPVYYIPPLVAQYISSDNVWVTIISLAITVLITNYISLPLMLRGVEKWQSRSR